MIELINIIWRNPGHWDIGNANGRIIRVRGIPGRHIVIYDQERDRANAEFKTVSLCMAHICEELMFELLEVSEKKDGNCTIKKTQKTIDNAINL